MANDNNTTCTDSQATAAFLKHAESMTPNQLAEWARKLGGSDNPKIMEKMTADAAHTVLGCTNIVGDPPTPPRQLGTTPPSKAAEAVTRL